MFHKVFSIWDDKNVIIVEGELSKLGVGNDIFDNVNSLKRILCTSRNAYEIYNKVLNEDVKLSDKNILILISLGPTATVLAYDLAKLGYWAIDIGHIDNEYEWLKLEAK